MKEKDIFDELDALHIKKTQEIEKFAEAVVKKLTKQQAGDLSAIRKAIADLRSVLADAKGLLRAAKQRQQEQQSRSAASRK
jgi:hypothetical protein